MSNYKLVVMSREGIELCLSKCKISKETGRLSTIFTNQDNAIRFRSLDDAEIARKTILLNSGVREDELRVVTW